MRMRTSRPARALGVAAATIVATAALAGTAAAGQQPGQGRQTNSPRANTTTTQPSTAARSFECLETIPRRMYNKRITGTISDAGAPSNVAVYNARVAGRTPWVLERALDHPSPSTAAPFDGLTNVWDFAPTGGFSSYSYRLSLTIDAGTAAASPAALESKPATGAWFDQAGGYTALRLTCRPA